jgi:dethiobiotin synthetase
MIFGSSTDVGKTIISAGLCLAALRSQRKVCYIKPIQTGELDEYFIQFYTNPKGINDIFVRTIQHWRMEMAPPLAVQYGDPMNESQAMSDDELVYSIQSEIKAFLDSEAENAASATSSSSSSSDMDRNVNMGVRVNEAATAVGISHGQKVAMSADKNQKKKKKDLFTVVETAGGVLSPGPHNTSQADMYRALRMPVLLVGDSRYGGISSTLCAYESLRMRGYNVLSVALIDRAEPGAPDNAMLIQNHINQTVNVRMSRTGGNSNSNSGSANNSANGGFSHNNEGDSVKVFTLSPMPMSQKTLLHSWFQQNEHAFQEIFTHLQICVRKEYEEFQQLVEDGRKLLWTTQQHGGKHMQHTTVSDGEVIGRERETEVLMDLVESAYGDHLKVFTAMDTNSKDERDGMNDREKQRDRVIEKSGKPKKACRDLVNVYDGTGSMHSQVCNTLFVS